WWWVSRTLVVMAVRNHCTGSGFKDPATTAHSCGLTYPTGVGSERHLCGLGDAGQMTADCCHQGLHEAEQQA
ncbi:MAG: hypothetical protein RLZZ11_1861, partial [Cyanobacteriota bacterium]